MNFWRSSMYKKLILLSWCFAQRWLVYQNKPQAYSCFHNLLHFKMACLTVTSLHCPLNLFQRIIRNLMTFFKKLMKIGTKCKYSNPAQCVKSRRVEKFDLENIYMGIKLKDDTTLFYVLYLSFIYFPFSKIVCVNNTHSWKHVYNLQY